MSSRIYTVSLKGSEVKVTDEQLSEFAAMYSVSDEIRSRISELLWLDLYIFDLEFGVSPDDVLREIKNLENGETDLQTKPASQCLFTIERRLLCPDKRTYCKGVRLVYKARRMGRAGSETYRTER